MDIRDTEWFGQLQISGSTKVINESGSLLAMQARFLQELRSLSPRELSEGKHVHFLFSTQPFPEQRASREFNNKLRDLESTLENSVNQDDTPRGGETYEEFLSRLLSSGLSVPVATYLANDWFDKPQDSTQLSWMTDPKADRFRKLNSSHAAYNAAMPSEYEALKTYVLEKYPVMCSAIVFRTA